MKKPNLNFLILFLWNWFGVPPLLLPEKKPKKAKSALILLEDKLLSREALAKKAWVNPASMLVYIRRFINSKIDDCLKKDPHYEGWFSESKAREDILRTLKVEGRFHCFGVSGKENKEDYQKTSGIRYAVITAVKGSRLINPFDCPPQPMTIGQEFDPEQFQMYDEVFGNIAYGKRTVSGLQKALDKQKAIVDNCKFALWMIAQDEKEERVFKKRMSKMPRSVA